MELSTARIHFNYEREMNGDKADANDKNPSGIHTKNSTQNGNKNENGIQHISLFISNPLLVYTQIIMSRNNNSMCYMFQGIMMLLMDQI